MPEGPETRRAADRLNEALEGRVAQEVFFAFPELKRFEQALTGRVVRNVEARGKAMLVRFRGGTNVYSHNQLYGKWHVSRAGTLPKTRRSLRFAVHGEDKSALLYSASEIEVLRDQQLRTHRYLGQLGPDVLHPDTRVEDVLGRLNDPRWSGRALAGILMEQSFLAGLGNYLRSEILFESEISPAMRSRDLSKSQRRKLARAILRVARRSYQTGGITNDLKLARELRGAGWPRRRFRHWVFARHGEKCHRCHSTIRRDIKASRRIFWCPTCQK